MVKPNRIVKLAMFLLCFAANVCTCANGVAETGALCLTNGAAKCKSCDAGWAIDDAKTKCICTYISVKR